MEWNEIVKPVEKRRKKKGRIKILEKVKKKLG